MHKSAILAPGTTIMTMVVAMVMTVILSSVSAAVE
jgi:hypothetical protein